MCVIFVIVFVVEDVCGDNFHHFIFNPKNKTKRKTKERKEKKQNKKKKKTKKQTRKQRKERKMNKLNLFICLFFIIISLSSSISSILTPITVTSSTINSGSLPSYAFDQLTSTSWSSSACRSGGWKTNPDLNLLTGICNKGLCSATCDAKKLNSSNDLSTYTGATIPFSHSEGRSWVRYDFPNGLVKDIVSIYIRGSWAVNTTLYGVLSTGQLSPITILNPVSNYLDINLLGPFPAISGLYIEARSKDGVMVGFCYAGVGDCQNFMVTEIAVQKAQCYEELTVDLGSNKLLSNFVAKYSGFIEGSVSTSIDGLTYANRITLGSPPVSSSQSAQYSFQNNIVGRYLKFR